MSTSSKRVRRQPPALSSVEIATIAAQAAASGDWSGAAAAWAEFRIAAPDEPLGYVEGAIALRRASRVDEAEALAKGAAKLFPDEPGPLV